jgi:outer membrane lipoprotein-sorting protein
MSLRRARLALAVLALVAAEPGASPSGNITVDDLLQHMASTSGVVAEFREIKTLKLLDAPLETRGTVYFAPPDRLARVTREPAETRLVLDGNRMRFQDAAGARDIDLADNPVARAFADNLIVLWRGDKAALEKIYALDFHADGARWQLALTPRHSPLDRFVRSIDLRGDGAAMQEMQVVETDGDKTQTLFEKTDVAHVFGEEESRAIFGPRPAP